MIAEEEGRKGTDKDIANKDYYRNWVGLFLFGTINNIFYVIVNSSAQDVCENFGKQKYIGAVLWCNIFFGLICRSTFSSKIFFVLFFGNFIFIFIFLKYLIAIHKQH